MNTRSGIAHSAMLRATVQSRYLGVVHQLIEAVRGISDPVEAMTEGVMFTLEDVAQTPHRGILLSEPHANTHSGCVASDEAKAFGMRMISRCDVDWKRNGYDQAGLRELVEFTLRVMLSFFVAPNPPTRSRDELRRFHKRWLGGAILAQEHWRAAVQTGASDWRIVITEEQPLA